MNPSYPIYIISKGRWESRLTSKSLERMNVPYHIVIEPQEYEQYASEINADKIYVLPFSNLGQGSIPARNWVWEHSLKTGAKRHWIMDDNISCFRRKHLGKRITVNDGTIFKCIEDFVDRYENVALAGPEYHHMQGFDVERPFKPIILNTRIYSCILILNNLPFRWRGKYNEDTDLSLRCLKAGWCTIQFRAFLQGKMGTMKMKGGNTDELYKQDKQFDGRWEMAKSLYQQHPDVAKITRKYGRWQHHVNYRKFALNRLIKVNPLKSYPASNEYGMQLKIKTNNSD